MNSGKGGANMTGVATKFVLNAPLGKPGIPVRNNPNNAKTVIPPTNRRNAL